LLSRCINTAWITQHPPEGVTRAQHESREALWSQGQVVSYDDDDDVDDDDDDDDDLLRR